MFMKRAAVVGEVPVETVMLSVCQDAEGKGDPKLKQQMSRDHFLIRSILWQASYLRKDAYMGRRMLADSAQNGHRNFWNT